jgi:hypothetical protein
MQLVSIGRIVHFFPASGDFARPDPIAAIVTMVHDPATGNVNLTLFPPASESRFRSSIKQRTKPDEKNCWDWPAKI